MSLTRSIDELLNIAEHHHDQYIRHLRLLHEATAKSPGNTSPGSTKMERTGSDGPAPSPALRAISFTSDPGSSAAQLAASKRSRRLTTEIPDLGHHPVPFTPLDKRLQSPSIYDGMSPDSCDEADEYVPQTPASRTTSAKAMPLEAPMSYVLEPLAQESFSEEDLATHLSSLDEAKPATVTALGDVWHMRNEMDASSILENFDPVEDGPYISATYEVYEVGRDGMPEAQHTNNGDEEGEVLEASTVWETLREVNSGGASVGRMTILQEPSPVMLGAAHMTMKRHFDMDELFQHLASTTGNKGKTRAYMNRAYETDSLKQRSFFFVFKYYTVVGEGLKPAPWQAYDSRPPDKRSPDHIDITECSAILALSLGGKPKKTVKSRVRRRGVAMQQGVIYDTFAPWHLLSIQCFPDDEHSMRSEESKRPFYNGPYAFLDSLGVEYRDTVKRYLKLNEMITKLITPPNHFMFDARLRDKLLFEDKDFTYSRRYFWAYNTLGVINDGIKSMRAAYFDTFTKDFWAGKHATLWPHPEPDTPEGRAYAGRMEVLRQELEAAMRDLQEVYDKNERTRTEIRSLREQLFSGSSVKESRRAIEQGDNIKILTSVSMIFLPLTFVTSVFGITTLTITANDWRFAVTMVSVCIPFFLLILILQTHAAMEAVRKSGLAITRSFHRTLARVRGTVPPASSTPGAVAGAEAGAGGLRRRWERGRRWRSSRSRSGAGEGGRLGLRRAQSGVGSVKGVEVTVWERVRGWRPWGRRTVTEGEKEVV